MLCYVMLCFAMLWASISQVKHFRFQLWLLLCFLSGVLYSLKLCVVSVCVCVSVSVSVSVFACTCVLFSVISATRVIVKRKEIKNESSLSVLVYPDMYGCFSLCQLFCTSIFPFLFLAFLRCWFSCGRFSVLVKAFDFKFVRSFVSRTEHL